MAKRLPKGDYFALRDIRTKYFPKRGYDPDPARSAEISEGRERLYTAHNPNWGNSRWDLFHFDPPRFRMPQELVLDRTAFNVEAPPGGLDHYMVLAFTDYAEVKNEVRMRYSYRVVSREWRAVIEQLEPAVHEFFPYRIEFTNHIDHRFVFRPFQPVPPDGASRRVWLRDDHTLFSATREEVSGRHLFTPGRESIIMTSRDMAALLLPLLPRFVNFVPLRFIQE